MAHNNLLIACNDSTDEPELKNFFSLNNMGQSWCSATVHTQDDSELDRLVFLVTKKPKCLVSHMQRIYYCFQKNLTDQLFASIVDFLIILNQQGEAISWRVVLGAKSRLTPEQFQKLKSYLKKDTNANLLCSNPYTVFSKGLIGINNVVLFVDEQEQDNDPLAIALDHIQYSQLDEAKTVLEEAILAQPERKDLRAELCGLYKSTGDSNGFHQMLAKLTRLGVSITDDWNQLNNYFKGLDNNG